jgi:hypothetical protein
MVSIAKIEYNGAERTSTKYVLIPDDQRSGDTLAILDMTADMQDAIWEDRREGHANEAGPRFGHAICRSLRAGRAHSEVTDRWRMAGGSEAHRPRIGVAGTWRILKKDAIRLIREWDFDV